jgi:DNA-binding NtrC family response regulator
VARIGETEEQRVDVRWVLASNEPGPEYGLAHDLVARLTVVPIPGLAARPADVPAIFLHVLAKALSRVGSDLAEVSGFLTADHFESLCLDGFEKNNTRGLIAIAESLAREMAAGTLPKVAVTRIFEKRYADGPVMHRSHAPAGRTGDTMSPGSYPPVGEEKVLVALKMDKAELELVKEAYYACHGVVVDMSAYLKKNHRVRLSRGRISKILDLLDLPRLKRHRP